MSVAGATVLVTGGTGSFGRRVAADLAVRGAREVRIFSRDEKKQYDMAQAHPGFRYVVGDVRDRARLDEAMRGVDYVFHAAALKQVPSCELAPLEALKTNTLGSVNVCEAAKAAGVRTVVALSTDKAVKPINAMGMTKALMEKVVVSQNLADSPTTFACVRYGNVMGSRGSVIPLFLDQIRRDVPLTVTDPEMTRFLLTLDEAVELVHHALTEARGGETFVRRSPAATVGLLARAMAARYSVDGENHRVEVTGTRAGEKVHEVLVGDHEMRRASESGGFFTIEPEYRVSARPGEAWEYTSENTERLDTIASVVALLERVGDVEQYR